MSKKKTKALVFKGVRAVIFFFLVIWFCIALVGNLITMFSTTGLANACGGESGFYGFTNYFFINIRCIYYYNTFNSNNDICNEWICGGDTFDFTTEGKCIENPQLIGSGWHDKCTKWHPKNICEINPEAEGCICDEHINTEQITDGYPCEGSCRNRTVQKCSMQFIDSSNTINTIEGDYKNYHNTGTCILMFSSDFVIPFTNSVRVYNSTITNCEQCWHYKQVCVKSHLPPTPIKIDLDKEKCVEHTEKNEDVKKFWDNIDTNCWKLYSISNMTNYPRGKKLYDKYCCIRKESKTECDKGNANYILSDSSMVYQTGEIVKVCRKKTISDLSCDDLWGCNYGCTTPIYNCYDRDLFCPAENIAGIYLKEYIGRCTGDK